MMTPKEALIRDNKSRPESDRIPVKEGRGRLSREANERVMYLATQPGYVIKGYEVSTSTPAPAYTGTVALGKTVKKVAVNNEKVIRDFVIFYEESMYKAVALDKTVYSMREVCNTCRVSLVQNHCESPTILGGIAVTITPR
jgi:hypothetical protein